MSWNEPSLLVIVQYKNSKNYYAIQEEFEWYYASAELNLLGYVVGYAAYQDLMGTADKAC
jgi:hypothetical protein